MSPLIPKNLVGCLKIKNKDGRVATVVKEAMPTNLTEEQKSKRGAHMSYMQYELLFDDGHKENVRLNSEWDPVDPDQMPKRGKKS